MTQLLSHKIRKPIFFKKKYHNCGPSPWSIHHTTHQILRQTPASSTFQRLSTTLSGQVVEHEEFGLEPHELIYIPVAAGIMIYRLWPKLALYWLYRYSLEDFMLVIQCQSCHMCPFKRVSQNPCWKSGHLCGFISASESKANDTSETTHLWFLWGYNGTMLRSNGI